MPLHPFQGNTFVAFTDIAGFKQMMRDRKRAARALDALYSSGYRALDAQRQHDIQVSGLFVSDCGILYAGDGDSPAQLKALCYVVARLHKWCFERAVQLTTSIAYGDFSYNHRIEFPGIEKNQIVGSAYLSAYIDQSASNPKIYAPEARIVRTDLPEEATLLCRSATDAIGRRMREEDNHFYFEWMRDDQHQD